MTVSGGATPPASLGGENQGRSTMNATKRNGTSGQSHEVFSATVLGLALMMMLTVWWWYVMR